MIEGDRQRSGAATNGVGDKSHDAPGTVRVTAFLPHADPGNSGNSPSIGPGGPGTRIWETSRSGTWDSGFPGEGFPAWEKSWNWGNPGCPLSHGIMGNDVNSRPRSDFWVSRIPRNSGKVSELDSMHMQKSLLVTYISKSNFCCISEYFCCPPGASPHLRN